MTAAEAVALQDEVGGQVAAIGGAPGFITFTGRDGRPVWIRAREVVVVERAAERWDPLYADELPPTADGTEYLRRRHDSIVARAKGHR